MRKINEMIVALYHFNQQTMKYSNGQAILFIAKLTFCLPILIYLVTIFDILERVLMKTYTYLPKSHIPTFAIFLLIYFILNQFTWKQKEVEAFLADEDNGEIIKNAWRLFLVLLMFSAILAVSVGYYNKWHPLTE